MGDVILISKLFLGNLPEDQIKNTNKQTHFQESVIKPSVTLTELYQLFIVTTLQRQVNKPAHPVDSEIEKILCEMLIGIPIQTVETVFCLSRLAYRSFFDWYGDSKQKTPKIVYTVEDLIQCGLKVTDNLYGLLKVVNTDQLPTDTVTFSFVHFTIQEFMCALYLATLPQEKQEQLLNENYHNYGNLFVFWSGLTGLVSHTAVQFICYSLQLGCPATAVQCMYESKQTNFVQPSEPFILDFDYHSFSLYECLALSTVLSHVPVEQLYMVESHVGDEGIRMLVTHYPNKANVGHHLKGIDLTDNDLTVIGAKLLAKVVMASKF